jgi:enterochelin esterase family protein
MNARFGDPFSAGASPRALNGSPDGRIHYLIVNRGKQSVTRTRIAAVAAFVVALIGVIWAVVPRSSAVGEFTEPEEGFDSPRLAALAKELKAGDQASLDRFWEELRGKAPLLEPVADDPSASWVTFVWRGDGQTRRMNVQGGPESGDYANWMKRLGHTDLWYRTDRIPNDSRFVYFFQVNRPLKFPPDADKHPPLAPPHADPLNPRKAADGSLVELAGAPPRPWLDRPPGAHQGALTEHRITSKIVRDAQPGFSHERQFMIYTPPNYDPKGPACGLLVFFDGQSQHAPEMPVPVILDHLIATGKVPPLVVVFVYQTAERNRELACSEPFADFVAKELIPWVRNKHRVSSEPERTIVSGISHGGLMAAYCGFRHSEVFGNVLSLSGGLGWWPALMEDRLDGEPGWLTRQFVAAPRLPVRFYLAAGSFENWHLPYSLLGENHRFRDVLEAKGYSVRYREFSGGHDRLGWRGPFVEGVSFLTSTRKLSMP